MLWRRSGEQGSCQTYEAATERISEPSAQQSHAGTSAFNTAFNMFQCWCLIKCLLDEQVGFRGGKMRGVMSQSVWGPEPPDYLAPQVMPEAAFEQQWRWWQPRLTKGGGLGAATDRQTERNFPLCLLCNWWQKTGTLFVFWRGDAEEYGWPFLSRAANL